MVLLALVGCVSQSKYDDLKKQLDKARADGAACEEARKGREADLEACSKGKQAEETGRLAAEKQSAELDQSMKASSAELEELRKQRKDNEARLAAFQALTAKFQKMIDTGTLRVRVRGGRMLVELPAGVLFASGKAELQKKGNDALTAVASVLKELKDRRFLVAGHTDNDPIKDSAFKDNWELSVQRALVVTKFLVGAGMDPHSLAAAGYSEYDPAASNKNRKGKQLNRRIEIVLEPRIDELPRLPESQ
jgi:chemotaxis protein MotB